MKTYKILLLPLCFWGGLPSSGGRPTSHGGGPPGGPVSSVAVHAATPTTVYASTEFGGVFKSLDGGDTWVAAESGLAGINSVASLVIAPSTPSTLYAATDQGVFRSTDGAATWIQKPFNLDVIITNVSALAVDPGSSTTVYAGADNGLLYKSIDGGDTWTAANSGLSSTTIKSLVIDPSTPLTIYAGTSNSGVFKTQMGEAFGRPAIPGLRSTPSFLWLSIRRRPQLSMREPMRAMLEAYSRAQTQAAPGPR